MKITKGDQIYRASFVGSEYIGDQSKLSVIETKFIVVGHVMDILVERKSHALSVVK